jgi:hypothetical protein
LCVSLYFCFLSTFNLFHLLCVFVTFLVFCQNALPVFFLTFLSFKITGFLDFVQRPVF